MKTAVSVKAYIHSSYERDGQIGSEQKTLSVVCNVSTLF